MKVLLNSDEYSDDELMFEDFKSEFYNLFDKLFEKYNIIIEARKSDWRGRTGYKFAINPKEILNAILDGNHFATTKIGYNEKTMICEVVSYGHDVPMGSNISLFAIFEKDNDIDFECLKNAKSIKFDEASHSFIIAD